MPTGHYGGVVQYGMNFDCTSVIIRTECCISIMGVMGEVHVGQEHKNKK
jgi:hypothetical protein